MRQNSYPAGCLTLLCFCSQAFSRPFPGEIARPFGFLPGRRHGRKMDGNPFRRIKGPGETEQGNQGQYSAPFHSSQVNRLVSVYGRDHPAPAKEVGKGGVRVLHHKPVPFKGMVYYL